MNRSGVLLLQLCFLCLAGFCQAQKYTDANWCIGDSVMLTHTTYPPTQGTSNSLFAFAEITVSQKDSLLFYLRSKWNTNKSDSIVLFDKFNQVILDSDSLNSSIGNKMILYIFFDSITHIYSQFIHIYSNSPSILDTSVYLHTVKTVPELKLITKNERVLRRRLTSGLSACKHSNGTDWWILSHGHGNNQFYRMLVSENGVEYVDSQAIGPIYSFGSFGYASFIVFNPQGSKLATINSEGSLNFYDFDRCTGLLSNNVDKGFTPKVSSFSGSRLMYLDGEFNRTGELFYLIRLDTLYQYDKMYTRRICWYDTLDLPEKSLIGIKYNHTSNVIYTAPGTSGSQTYVPTDKDFRMGIIEHPDSLGAACSYKHGALYLNGRRAPGGFGSTVNHNLGALGQAYPWPQSSLKDGPPPLCAGDSVRLGEDFTEPGISYQWAPAAGLSCTTCFAPKAAPAQTTTYTLYTTSTNACGLLSDSATVTVVIDNAPPVANAGADQIICAGSSQQIGGPALPGLTYLWLPTAETTAQITVAPSQTTVYTLTVSNSCGFQSQDTVTVGVLPPSQVVINLGSDRTICAGDSLTIGVVPAPNVAYSWNTDATTASIGIRPEQTTTYILQAVDTSASCGEPIPVLDTLTVTVLPRNVLTVTLPPDTAICSGANLTLTPVLTGTGSVLWSTCATTPSITVEPTATTTYTLTYSGTACDTPGTATVTVTVLPPDASPCRTARPDETTAQIRIYPNPTTGPLTVELPAGIRTDIDLLNAIGQGLLRVVNRSGTVHLDLTPYPDGYYYLMVKGQRTRVVLRK
jgi:hypothetical protein